MEYLDTEINGAVFLMIIKCFSVTEIKQTNKNNYKLGIFRSTLVVGNNNKILDSYKLYYEITNTNHSE